MLDRRRRQRVDRDYLEGCLSDGGLPYTPLSFVVEHEQESALILMLPHVLSTRSLYKMVFRFVNGKTSSSIRALLSQRHSELQSLETDTNLGFERHRNSTYRENWRGLRKESPHALRKKMAALEEEKAIRD